MLLARLVDESAGFLPSGALESFRADLGLTYAQAGTVLAAIWPGALVGSAFSAAADRYSRRVIASGGAFGFAVAMAGFATGRSFAALLTSAVVLGAASTAMVDVAEISLVELAGDDLRRHLARSNVLGVMGDILGPVIIAGVALCGFSWRVGFAAGAVLLVVYGVMLAVAPLPPPGRSRDDEQPSVRSQFAEVLRDPAVWMIGLMGVLMGPFDEPLLGFTIALAEQERASAAVAGVVAIIGVSGGLLSFTVLARRFEETDDHRLLAGAAAAMTVGCGLIALVPVLVVVAAGAFVVSVALNLAWLALQHRELTVRPGQVGTTLAVLGVLELTGFWIPTAIGAVADRAGLGAAVGTFGLLGVLLAALAWRGRRRSVGTDVASGA